MPTSMFDYLPSSTCLHSPQGDQPIRAVSPPSPVSVARVPSTTHTLPPGVEISMHYPIGGTVHGGAPKPRIMTPMGDRVPQFPPRTDSSMSDPMSGYLAVSTRRGPSVNLLTTAHSSNVNPYHPSAGAPGSLRSVSSEGYSFPEFSANRHGAHHHGYTHTHSHVQHRPDMSQMLGLSSWLPTSTTGYRRDAASAHPHPFSRHSATANDGPFHNLCEPHMYGGAATLTAHLVHPGSQPHSGVQGKDVGTSLPNATANSSDLDITANDISAFLDNLGRSVNWPGHNDALMSERSPQGTGLAPYLFAANTLKAGTDFDMKAVGSSAPKRLLQRANLNSTASTGTSNSGVSNSSQAPSMATRTVSSASVMISGSHSRNLQAGSPNMATLSGMCSPTRNTATDGLQSLPALTATTGNQLSSLNAGGESEILFSYVMESDENSFSTLRDFSPWAQSMYKKQDVRVDMDIDDVFIQEKTVAEGKGKRKRNSAAKSTVAAGPRSSRKRAQTAAAAETLSLNTVQSERATPVVANHSEKPNPVASVVKSAAPTKVVKRQRRPAHLLTRQHMCMHEDCGKKYEEWRSLQAHVLAIHGYRINRCDYLAQTEETDSDGTQPESTPSPGSNSLKQLAAFD